MNKSNFQNAISQKNKDILIHIIVTANASNKIFPAGYNQWRNKIEIKVKEKPKDNKANQEIIETIAEYFNLSHKMITITSGEKNREKTILIKNISKQQIIKKIGDSLNGNQ